MIRRRRAFLFTAAVVLCVLFVWAGRSYTTYLANLTSLGDLVLGDSRDHVKYKLGFPPVVESERRVGQKWVALYYTDRSRDPKNAMPDGTNINQYRVWGYEGPHAQVHLDVTFDESGSTSRIECFDLAEPPTVYCPRLLDLGIADSEVRVFGVFGTPTQELLEDGVKTLYFSDIGVDIRLQKQRVYSIAVYRRPDSEFAPLGRFLRWFLHT